MAINSINFNTVLSALIANLKKLGFQHISIKHNACGNVVSGNKNNDYLELFVFQSEIDVFWNFDMDWSPRSRKLHMKANEVIEFIRNF